MLFLHTRSFIFVIYIGITVFTGKILAQEDSCDIIVQEGELIQDAINGASSGDIICVEPGVYEEDLTINTDSLTLTSADEGENPVNTGSITVSGVENVLISRFTIQDVNNDGIDIENSTGVEIRNNQLINNHNGVTSVNSSQLVIEGNEIKDQQSGFRRGYGIDIETSDSVQIKDNLIAENDGEAIRLVDSPYAIVSNNEIMNNSGSGVFAEESDNIAVIDNIMDGQNAYGIHLEESTGVLIEANTITDSRFWGIIVEEYSHEPVILHNTISGHDADIKIIESAFAELKHNILETGLVIDPDNIRFDFDAGSSYYDLDMENNTVNGGPLFYAKNVHDPEIPSDAQQVIIYNSTDVAVTDMDFSDVSVGLQIAYSNFAEISNVSANNHTMDGVRLIVSRYSSVTNSTFNENTAHGLYLESSDTSTVHNNYALNNGEKGMVAFWSTGNVFSNNTAVGNVDIGIHQWNSPDGRVQDNTAKENKIGIHIERSSRTSVHNNISNNNEEYGFRLILKRNPDVRDNEARYNGWGGMRFSNASSTGFVTGNEITDNGRSGIWLETLSTSNNDITVSENIVTDNGRRGINLPRSDDVSVLQNTIERNDEDGIYLSNSHNVSMIDNTISDNGGYGIYLNNRVNQFASVEDNTLSGHSVDVHVDDVQQANRIRNNSFQTGILLSGEEEAHYTHIIVNNTVRDKELFYSRNQDTVAIPGDPGQVIVVNANIVEIDSFEFTDVAAGVQIVFTDTVSISNTSVDRSVIGAKLVENEYYFVDNNTFRNNNTGLYLQGEFTLATLVDNEFLINEVGLNAQNLDGTADARNNWWGDESGPGGGIEDPETGAIADGDGDVIEGTVRFDPWLGSGTELDAPFFTVTIDSTNSPVHETEDLVVDVTITNEGDGRASREIELYNPDADLVDSIELTLDADSTAAITLVWTTGEGDAGEGMVTVHSQDDSDTVGVIIDDVTSISDDPAIAEEYQLSQNYPNPFNPATTIQFALPEAGVVQLTVYDLLGRKVETLIDGHTEAGYHDVVFDARHLSSGVYIYQIRAGDFVETKRFMLLK